jgi:glyoxylase-like metal-dependent hydrolase (beta-lactamase superfamily II)
MSMSHGAMSHVESFHVGPFEVSTLCQGFAPLELADECPGRDVDWGAERRRHPWAFHDDRSWPWHVHAFAVSGPHGLVLVDAGLGAYAPFRPWAPGSGATPEDAYASAGIDPTLVRLVVLSHLHADHAGGVWADGAPRFPNARHVLHEADLDFFRSSPDPDEYAAIDELRSIDALGMLDAGPDDREVMPGMRVVHSPGHTPGHRSVIVGSGAESLLLTGDLLHLPVQAAHPTWLSSHDVDPEAAAASRSAILRLAEGSGWRIGVQHFSRPFGRVDARGWTST